jgi:hypothetical protein
MGIFDALTTAVSGLQSRAFDWYSMSIGHLYDLDHRCRESRGMFQSKTGVRTLVTIMSVAGVRASA